MLYIIILYIWLFVHRPFEIWPALSELRIERIYMLLALVYWAVLARKRWIPNPLHWALFAFSGAVLACWLASPFSREEKPDVVVENFAKQLVFYVLLVTSVSTKDDLRKVCTAFLGIMGLYMAHSLREYRAGRHFYRMGIERMIGVDQTMNDPNSFGSSIVYALPLVVPIWLVARGRLGRAILVGYVGLSLLCVILTGSRTSMVGVAAIVAIAALRTRHRFKLLAAAVLLSPLAWLAMPESLQTRFYSIIDPSVGPANAQESAEQRAEGFLVGAALWQQYPATGCGPGAWIPATGLKIESHNLFGQVLGEMGTLGVVTFSSILILFWWNVRRIHRAYREHPEWEKDFLYRLVEALAVGVLLLLFLGLASHNAYRFSWQWYSAFLIIASDCIRQRIDAEACAGPEMMNNDYEESSPGALAWTLTQS
jgi:hypothetical protein